MIHFNFEKFDLLHHLQCFQSSLRVLLTGLEEDGDSSVGRARVLADSPNKAPYKDSWSF